MAITTNASYVPTLTEFLGHWQDVNDARGTANLGPLVLNTGRGVADLEALRADLLAVEATLQSRLNDQQLARGSMTATKTALMGWANRFLGVFDASFATSPWANARPALEQPGMATENFVRPLLDVADLWSRMDALTGPAVPPGLTVPVVLLGQTEGETLTQSEFVTLIANLRAHADKETVAAGRVRRSRSRRKFLQDQAYDAMKLYRQAMPPSLPRGDDLQDTLPRLLPADTGSTPEPVAASAVYVSGATSKIVYEPSAAADVKEYQLRGTIGEEWNEDDAVTVATHPAGHVPREFAVDFGLTEPGTSVVFKVYVVTNTGRERGGAPMVVLRPTA